MKKLTAVLFIIAVILVTNGCQRLPITGERGMVYDLSHPVTLDAWIDSEDGQGGGSR